MLRINSAASVGEASEGLERDDFHDFHWLEYYSNKAEDDAFYEFWKMVSKKYSNK